MIKKITPRCKNSLLFIVTLFLSSQLFSQTQTFNNPTNNGLPANQFTVPAGVTSVTFQAWGAGGGGSNRAGAAGGGGGGAYAGGTITGLTAGDIITIYVGVGGTAGVSGQNTTINTTPTIITNGGASSTTRTGGNGGIASIIAGFITVSNDGGKGGNARGSNSGGNNEGGGGGGGSASASADGSPGGNGSGTTGGAGGAGFALGGVGAAAGGTPDAGMGANPGAGGGGRGEGLSTSKSGGNGQVILTWTVSLPPTITSLGATSGCVGTSITINGTNLTGATAANVTIGGIAVTSITSNNGSVLVAVIGAGATGTVSVTTAGGTATSAGTFTVNPLPAQPSTITGNTTPCSGTSQTYSVTNVPGVTYTWALPSGWVQTAGGTTNSITVTTSGTSGNITVTPSNPCVGTARTLAVTTSTVPAQPSVITGSATPCQGTSQTYSVTNVAGVTYTWVFPSGWSQTAGGTTNSVSVTTNGTSGTITVTPSNTCGNGTARTLAITTSTLPAQPSVITGSTTLCQGTSQTYSVTNVSGITYNWAFPSGWVQTAGGTTNSITVTVGATSGNITVTPSSSCGSGTVQTLATTVNASPIITGTTPGSRTGIGTVDLSATASAGTISWYANLTGGSALGTGTNFTTPGIINTTTYYVDTNNGSCTSTPRVAVVATVNYAEITVLGNGNIILDEDTSPITTDYTNLGSSAIAVGLTRTYTIQNSGTVDLTIGAITIGGLNASEFVVSTAPAASVAPAGSTTFSITFTPTALGIRNANVSFITNDADENPFNFDIAGTGSTGLIPEINIRGLGGNNIIDGDAGTSTVNGTDFGSITMPGTVVRTFTIQNTGTGPLLLTGVPIVTITGSSDFTVTAQPASNTIAAGSSLTFQITFNPSVTGTSLGIVSIYNNDANEGIYDFAIKGFAGVSGREIDIQGNEVSIIDGDTTPSAIDQTDFGLTDATTPISMVYTVHNFGNSSLTLNSNITITGANSSMFSATTLSTTLIAGGVDWFVVTFNPTTSTGVKTATITVTSNDADEGAYDFVISAEVQTLPALTVAPGGITANLKLWLKADSNIGSIADNTTIYTWYDQTFGSTKNAISKFSKEPKFRNNPANNVNFNPVVYFNGNNYMSGGQGFNDIDMFVVVKPTNNVNYTTSPMDIYCGDDITINGGSQDVTGFEMGNTSARHTNELMAYNQGAGTGTVGFGVAEISTSKFYAGVNIFNPRRNATFPTPKMDILNNGNTLATSVVSNNAYKNIVNSRYWLGRSEYWDASYDGDILEIINYNTRNSDADKRKIETYLAIKYGITLGINGASLNYVNSGGSTIYGAGAGFNYNIAGIGRDDNSQLNQKQSKTENTNTDITIGLGNIFDTNSDNPNSFANDKDFLVWGHNNNTLAAQTPIIVNMSAGKLPVGSLFTEVDFISIGRTWRVIETGGNVPSVKVSIPSTMLTATLNPPGDFLMFISSSPIFSPTAEYRIMRMNGTNLEANYDFSGTKYITFGYAPERTFVRSIDFDGVNDYLDAGNVLDLNTSFTVSAWIKRSGTNQTILSKRNSSFTTGYDLSINGSGNVAMRWMNGSMQTLTSSVSIPAGKWHNVAVIYDSTLPTDKAKLFIDGVKDTSANLTIPIANSESFLIAAADGTTPTSFFNGTIDEVRIWDIALSEKKLRYVMNQEISRNATFTGGTIIPNMITLNEIGSVLWTNLSAYYPMSTYTFTNAKDISNNNYTAALKNLTTVDRQTAPLPYESQAAGAWNTPGTWLNISVQDLPNSASIVNASISVDWNIVQTTHNITSGARDITVLGLKNNAGKLTIDGLTNIATGTGTGQGLRVTHYLELDGSIDLEGESQLVQDQGSILDADSGGDLERDQQGTANSFNYNYWSSSVGPKALTGASTRGTGLPSVNAPFTIKGIINDGRAIPLSIVYGTSPYAADAGPGAQLTISSYWLYQFYGKHDDYNSWFPRINETYPLAPGVGYTMKGSSGKVPITNQQNYVFRGKPYNGDFLLPLVKGTGYIPANPTGEVNRLIGNPYPSALDANEFILDNLSGRHPSGNNIFNGALYFWDHFGEENTHILREYVGGYATRNLTAGAPAISNDSRINNNLATGTKIPQQYIPVGQGFFVGTKLDVALTGIASVTGGNIVFKNSQRVFQKETPANSVFMKSAKTKGESNQKTEENTNTRPIIRLLYDSPTGYHRQIVMGMVENTSNHFDLGYDAPIADINKEDMYWTFDGAKFVIQGVPNFDDNQEFPLGLIVSKTGLARIKIDALENVGGNISVYIKDNLLGKTHNISQNPFEIELEAGTYANRFAVIFKMHKLVEDDVAVAITEDEQLLIAGIQVFMDNTIGELQIKNTGDTGITRLALYNYLGQTIKIWNSNLNRRTVSLPINAASGVYLLQINTKTGALNTKIIIE